MNENLINVENLRPFPRFFCTIGILPTSFRMRYTYEEQIMEIIKFIKEEIIPKVNMNALATQELQEKFVELVNYVETYLDNLDVQDEINNKLDDMVEDGTLQEIITAYINLKSILSFDNVADMKAATNLVNGSYVETYGFHSLNDGGSAKYKIRTITNSDVIDESFIIALSDNTLIAELIYDKTINVKKFGLYGDNLHDDSELLQNIINKVPVGTTIYFPIGIYLLHDINITKRLNLIGESVNSIQSNIGSCLKLNSANYNLFNIHGQTNAVLMGLNIKNLLFEGNNLEGNLLNIQSVTFMNIKECSFVNINGSAIKVRHFFESNIINNTFRICGNENANVIEMGDIVDTSSNNTNNLHIENNTFGYNSGSWIKATSNSRIDLVWIINNKFEWDGTPVNANETNKSVIDLLFVNRCYIKGNGFTYFSPNYNKYNNIINIGQGNGFVEIKDNEVINANSGDDFSIYFVEVTSSPVIMKDNVLYNLTGNHMIKDIKINANNQIAHYVRPSQRRTSSNIILSDHSVINNYIPIYELPTTSGAPRNYEVDDTSANYTKQSTLATGATTYLFDIPMAVKNNGNSVKIKVRAKLLQLEGMNLNVIGLNSEGSAVVNRFSNELNTQNWKWYTVELTTSEIENIEKVRLVVATSTPSRKAHVDGIIVEY